MNLHLEFSGKNAHVSLRALPRTAEPSKGQRITSTGPVERLNVLSGLKARPNDKSKTAEALIVGDPELDLNQIGRILNHESLTGVYLDPTCDKPVGDFEIVEVVTEPSGEVKETRKQPNRNANLDTATPIKVAKTFPLATIMTRFVFKSTLQLVHEDGLTKSFLYDIAKALETKQEAALLGSGLKGTGPLILRNGQLPVRGFLVGQTKGNEYKLLLLLTDTELKRPAAAAAPAAAPAPAEPAKQAASA